jgi:DNA adenine methylase
VLLMAERLAPVLRYPGAKWRLADWILAHVPPHEIYLEPFFGSGAVFFRKNRVRVETINDLDGRVINLFSVLRDSPDALERAVRLTPYSRTEYERSYERSDDPLEDARRFLVRCWQAHAIKVGSTSGWRFELTDSRGRSACGDWLTCAERISTTAERLQGVYIENRPAEMIIAAYASSNGAPRTLIYADPPYLLTTSPRYYRNNMSLEEHGALLELLNEHAGPALVSGYPHPLYDNLLRDWQRVESFAQAEKGRSRTEVLWINPVAAEALGARLF